MENLFIRKHLFRLSGLDSGMVASAGVKLTNQRLLELTLQRYLKRLGIKKFDTTIYAKRVFRWYNNLKIVRLYRTLESYEELKDRFEELSNDHTRVKHDGITTRKLLAEHEKFTRRLPGAIELLVKDNEAKIEKYSPGFKKRQQEKKDALKQARDIFGDGSFESSMIDLPEVFMKGYPSIVSDFEGISKDHLKGNTPEVKTVEEVRREARENSAETAKKIGDYQSPFSGVSKLDKGQ